jgi:hypothetical protein
MPILRNKPYAGEGTDCELHNEHAISGAYATKRKRGIGQIWGILQLGMNQMGAIEAITDPL